MANSTVPTSAVPAAAPIERESCTEAAAAPSEAVPAAFCTVTCTTPITVPMNRPVKNRKSDSWRVPRSPARRPSATRAATTTINPREGYMAVRPVRLTTRPVTIEPAPMPNISGSISSPVSDAEVPRSTRR